MPHIHLSIIIPTHRRPELLGRAVRSALASGRPDVEVLVIGDRDPDAGRVLAEWADTPQLRVMHNTGDSGASGTRNFGVAAARGDVILFLDDDDELMREYPARVLEHAQTGQASWGFAAIMQRGPDGVLSQAVGRAGWRGGGPAGAVPFRRKIAGLGCGFWIRRTVYEAVGGLGVAQTLDEDTDLCCRLVAGGHVPWFDAAPAMIIDRSDGIQRLTSATDAQTRALCYLRTYERNGAALADQRGAQAYLAHRAQRMILRSGQHDLLPRLMAQGPGFGLRMGLWAKRVIRALRRG